MPPIRPRFTDVAMLIRERGPDRVIISKHGEGTTPKRAEDIYKITPRVIFVRNDGWSLGAPARFEKLAERLYRDHWIGVMRKKENGEWVEELYNKAQ